MKLYWGLRKKKKDDEDIDIEMNSKGNGNPFIEPTYLETVDNRIYFYSEITRESVLQLNKQLRQMCNQFQMEAKIKDSAVPDKIFLHINSYGGDLFAGFSVIDQILNIRKTTPIEIVSIVDGCSASAASMIGVVCSKRLISEHSKILIHQLSTSFWGNYSQLEDEMDNSKQLMEMIKGVYLKYTKISEKELKELLKHDLWLDAEDCIKKGLVDEII